MAEVNDLKVRLGLPPVSQIGVIVRDVYKVADYYTSLFGVGPFTIYDFSPDQHIYNGEPTIAKIRMGNVCGATSSWSCSSPSKGDRPIWTSFATRGEGLHHLGFFVSNFDELCENFQREGFKPVLEPSSYVEQYKGSVKVRYWDTDKIVGVLFRSSWKSWLPECQPGRALGADREREPKGGTYEEIVSGFGCARRVGRFRGRRACRAARKVRLRRRPFGAF